ncbi:MAG: inosamine-phosphate amidinotransferase 1 [Acidobacteriota bacterium]|nr:inosamine-phosphate amidinotransferase 1 [Acidobacteriota bacterium]
MILNSHNEWGKLQTVVVGRADHARVPVDDVSLRAINYAGNRRRAVPHGPYPQAVIDEANEDLEYLCGVFVNAGVTVYRPEVPDTVLEHGVGHWRSDGYYAFCPRDGLLVVGDTVIESPMVLRARYTDAFPYRRILQEAMRDGARWLAAPRPQLPDEGYDETADRDHKSLRNLEPVFDAANVLRADRDLLFLESNSGNSLGALWLQRALGTEYRVHLLSGIYSYMHLDSTISLLRPGLALLNPARLNAGNLPPFFAGWRLLWCPDPVDIGFHAPYEHASQWVGMNLLMLDPQTAVVERSQLPLIRMLEAEGIEVIPVPIRHARTMGGAVHCVTLDLHRH